jgi:hypothetical protein
VHRRDPGVRPGDSAARRGVTERTACRIVTDLTRAGYVVEHEDGRRNRCEIQAPPAAPRGPAGGNAPPARSRPSRLAPTTKRPDHSGRRHRERHRRTRHLVTPGTVITPAVASADGRPVLGRAQQAAGDGSTRDGASRRLRRRDASQKAQTGSGLQMPPDL